MKKIFLSFLLAGFISTNFFGISENFGFSEKTYAACTEEDQAKGLPCSENGIKTLEKNQDQIDSGISKKSFRSSVMDTLNYFLILLGILGVLVIIYSGVQAIVGGEEEVKNAKGRILGVVIGFVIIFLSYSVINFISNIGGDSNSGNTVVDGGDTVNNGDLNSPLDGDQLYLDKNGNPILTPDGKPIYVDKDGNLYTIDKNGNKQLVDKNGNPILTPDGKPIYVDKDGNLYTIDKDGNKQLVDKNGNPILTPDGKPVYIDENGDFYSIDDAGNKYKVDKNGDPILNDKGNLIYLETAVKIFVDGKEIKSVLRINLLDSSVKGILFDPSHSVVKDGREIQEYTWEFGDGNTDYFETSEPVRQIYESAGIYNLTLSIKDDLNKISKKRIKVIVQNLSADIRISPDYINLGAKVSFDGSESKSSDGKISAYKWEVLNSFGKIIVTSDQKNFSFVPKAAGKYKVGLTVKNLKGKKDYLEKTFLVNSNKPKAMFNYSNKSISTPGVFIFDGGSSYDIDHDVLSYSWDFNGDGRYEIVNGKKFKATYSYDKVGDYNVYLKVEDQFGKFDIFNQKVSVTSVLNVNFNVDRYASQKGSNITFTPVVPVGVNSILWDFKDGKKETTTGLDTISHTFNESGIYTIKMTAINSDGEQNSIIKNVFIGDGEYPVGVFSTLVNGEKRFGKVDLCGDGRDGIEVTRLDQIEVNAKDSVNIDNTNGGLSYTWDFGDGNLAETQVARYKYRMIRDECYPIKVSVKDNSSKKVSKISDTMRVKVVNSLPNPGGLQIVADQNKLGEYVTPLKVSLKLNNAFDKDGNIVKYKWYYQRPFTDKKLGYVETYTDNVDMLIDADGVKGLTNDYIFNVEVVDNEGGKNSIFKTEGEVNKISIKNGETKSINLDFEASRTQVAVGDQVTFRVKDKSSKGNLTYSWDFDGDDKIDKSVSSKTIEHTFDKKGVFKVELRVEKNGVFKKVYKTIYVDESSSGEKMGGNLSENIKNTGSGEKIDYEINKNELISTKLGVKLKGEGIALTSLNVRYNKYPNNKYEIISHISNSDASIYEGPVEFQIMEGKGEISKPEVTAISSIAKTIFTKKGDGIVKIKIIAKDTIYGDLEEIILIK